MMTTRYTSLLIIVNHSGYSLVKTSFRCFNVFIVPLCFPFIIMLLLFLAFFPPLSSYFFSTYFHRCVSEPFFSSLSGGGTPLGTVGARAPQASLEPERSLQTVCLRPDRTPLY